MQAPRYFLSLITGVFIFTALACQKEGKLFPQQPETTSGTIDYRMELRSFIQEISEWAKQRQPGFLIVPQNSSNLLTESGDPQDTPVNTYMKAIDGIGREELLYGYDNQDDTPTPADVRNEWLGLCTLAKNKHLPVLTTDYCYSSARMATSYRSNELYGFISFAASHRELDNIPDATPYRENTANISKLADARNFLYLINTRQFNGNQPLLDALKATNYDVLIIDAFPEEGRKPLSKNEIASLKIKKNGGRRLVLGYMSIGQAEQYRWYWKNEWKTDPPEWLEQKDDYWKGNYFVRYWMPEWKSLIYGNSGSYTQKLLDAGFDGAYLDPVDGDQHWGE